MSSLSRYLRVLRGEIIYSLLYRSYVVARLGVIHGGCVLRRYKMHFPILSFDYFVIS